MNWVLQVTALWIFQSYLNSSETLAAYYFAKVIAAAVASNKEKYNEAFLGKDNDEYCAWILNPEKWGGIFA